MSWRLLGGIPVLLAAALMCIGAAHAQPGLVLNADVETDTDADGIPNDWFHSSGVSYPSDNGPSSAGLKSIQNDSAGQDWRSEVFPIIPGGMYQWSFDYKFLDGATGEFRNQLRFFDGGDFKGEDNAIIAASNIGQWQTSTRMLTAPVFAPDNPFGNNQADIRVTSGVFEAGNGLVRFDNFIVRLVPEPSALLLCGLASLGFGLIRTRRRMS